MLRITNILNPLTGGASTEEYRWEKGKPLSGYMDYAGECVVACGGNIIELPLDEIFPTAIEEYMVMPIPAGGDNQTWRTLGFVAMGAVSFIPGVGVPLAMIGGTLISLFLKDKVKDQATSESYAWQHRSSPMASHGVAMSVVYGKARVRPVLKNRYITVKDDKQRLYALYGLAAHKVDEISLAAAQRYVIGATYPFGTIVRTTEELFVGESLDEPGKTYRCKNRAGSEDTFYTDTDHWEVWRGTASFNNNIIINGRAISDYNRDVRWETRPGLPEQAVIVGFDVTYSNFVQNQILYPNFPVINRQEAVIAPLTTPLPSRFSWNQHTLLFQGETYIIQTPSFKALTLGSTNYIYFDTAQDTDTYYISTTEPTGDTQHLIATYTGGANILYNHETALPAETDWYNPVLTITNTHNIELMFEFPYGLYGQPFGREMTSATCRLFAQYRELDTTKWLNFISLSNFADPDYDIPYSTDDIVAGAVVRKKPEIFNISIKAADEQSPLEYGKSYQIRITASSPTIVKLVNVATIVYGEENADGTSPGFTYPGEPLLGIKALASGQISGDIDVQVDVERSNVWVYNTRSSTWVQGAANNHAWAVYDILANGHPDHPAYPTGGNDDAEASYGCGIDKDRLDYESFRAWAEHIGSEGLEYELNIVFDTFMTAWDAILRICQEGRGMVYPVGTKIYAFTDKATDITQVFTMGNIHLDTFVQNYVEAAQKINMIEANYWDKDRSYEKTTIAARTADWDASTGLSVPTTITLYGTDNFNQAWSITRFILMGNELLDNVISFGVDVDALAAQAGDRVEVQHDVLTTGSGGRITAVDTVAGSITVDRTLGITSGITYELTIYHNDGTIERKSVTGGSDTDTIVWGPAAWKWDTVPSVYEVYSFGVPDAHVKTYRVTDISRTNELMRTLTLVQYDEALYDSYTPDQVAPPVEEGQFSLAKALPSRTTVEKLADLLNLASNVQLREVLSRNRVTGEYESSVVVTWDTVLGDPRGSWEVWFRDVDASDVDWQGTWEQRTHGQGDKVEHGGKTYISLEDGNVSRPFTR